jgi:SagB-type dehydrogenase family enzyme
MSALSCLEYHNLTSYDRRKMDAHFLDWTNQPDLYKNYPDIKPLLLPQDTEFPGIYLSQLLKKGGRPPGPEVIDQKDLARIFQLTYSLTAKTQHWKETFYYRSAASAGALYPTELYIDLQKIRGLDDGLYHFSLAQQALHPLRKWEDHGSRIEDPYPESPAASKLIFFLTAVLFRSSWKYRERAFRYHLLDTGHVLENLILTLRSLGFPFTLVYDFDDPMINRLLGLDQNKETILAMVHVPAPGVEETQWRDLEDLPDSVKKASQVSRTEIAYPLIEKMVKATTRVTRHLEMETAPIAELGLQAEAGIPITSPGKWPETMTFPDSVINRRSRRNYVKKPVSQDAFLALLEGLGDQSEETPEGFPLRGDLLSVGLLIGQVEGFEPGFYLLDPFRFKLGRLSKGSLTDAMAGVCLDQRWLANAAIHFLFLADLETLDKRFGPRGYRYAMMTAGRAGERLYLLATALGLGCCGIGAFYDPEAWEILKLDENFRLLYLVAVGPYKSKGS